MFHNFILSESLFLFLKALEIESYTWIVLLLIVFPLLLPYVSMLVLVRTSCGLLSLNEFVRFNIGLHVCTGR